MQKVLNLYKPIGVTPLQLIEQFKKENPEYKSQKLGYAGRLDPMAEGVLLVLVGEENEKRKEYERLKKEYEFDVLFGIKTDSYDILGKIEKFEILNSKFETNSNFQNSEIKKLINTYIGKRLQKYPPYSSPRVKGKPLFYWAREGRLSEIEIPKKEIEIYDFKIIKEYKLTSKKLQKIIFERISKVKGVFRQDEIIKGWEEFFKKKHNAVFTIFKFHISCSSGTYIRSIANEIGGMALNIKRIRVGEYIIKGSLRV